MNKNLPLHTTVHWRRFREMAKELFKLEGINPANYNLNKVICYRAFGVELEGSNVTYKTKDRKSLLGNG
jgi:hypothetical protein